MANKKAEKVLIRALDMFGLRGSRWCQGEEEIAPGETGEKHGKELTFKQGAYCSIGAIYKVDGRTAPSGADDLLADSIRELYPKFDEESSTYTIIDFNDDEKRSFTDIRRVFQRAIEMARGKNGKSKDSDDHHR